MVAVGVKNEWSTCNLRGLYVDYGHTAAGPFVDTWRSDMLARIPIAHPRAEPLSVFFQSHWQIRF